jgi:O-antigen ligase/tetratricopeptide (TPR) repeat protein
MGNSDHSRQYGRIGLALIWAMLALTPVIFWRGALESFESCKTALLQLTALALLVTAGVACSSELLRGGLGWQALRKECIGLAPDPLSHVVLLGALAALLSTINSSSVLTSWQGHHEHCMGLKTLLALLTIYFAVRTVCCDDRAVRLFSVAVVLALVPAVLYALIQAAGLDPFRWELGSPFAGWIRPIGTLGHPNYLAGYIVMAMPLVLWLAYQSALEGQRRLVVGLVILVVAGLAVIVLSLSRAAWLAGGVVVVSAAWLATIRRGIAPQTLLRSVANRRNAVLVAVPACLLMAIALAAFAFTPLRERLCQVFTFGGRRALWRTAWSVFVEHPWTGCGLETFDLAFRKHGTADFWRLEWGMSASWAHDDLLHTLATQGIVGGIAFLLLAGTLAWAVRRALRTGRVVDRPLVLALAATVLTWYVQNMFGFPVVPTASLFVVVAAILSRLAWPAAIEELKSARSGAHHQAHLAFRIVAGTLIAAGANAAYLSVVRPFLAVCACHEGEDLAQTHPDEALLCHERAVSLDPNRDMLWVKLGARAKSAAERCLNVEKRHQLLLRAHEATEQACRLVPVNGENHANRALVLLAMAKERLVSPQEVLSAYNMALALDSENTLYLAEAGSAAIATGLLDRARDYVERGLRIEPDLGVLNADLAALDLAAGHYHEAELHVRAALDGQWHDTNHFLRARALLCVILLDTGREDEALKVADNLLRWESSLPIRCLRARALEKLGRSREAEAEYRRIVELRPDHRMARAGLARLVRSSGNGASRQGLPAGSAD